MTLVSEKCIVVAKPLMLPILAVISFWVFVGDEAISRGSRPTWSISNPKADEIKKETQGNWALSNAFSVEKCRVVCASPVST